MKHFCIFFLSLVFSLQSFAQKEITVTDIYTNRAFYAKSIESINWMKDGSYYSALENNSIVKHSIVDGKAIETIFDGNSDKTSINIDDYSFNLKENKILILTDFSPIYRRSFTANYFVYDVKKKSLTELSKNGAQSYATFSPDGNYVAYARNNNLYVTDLSDMSEKAITTDGKFNHIINGSSDWVYEEEFSITKAFYWSNDSKNIAYIKFNETDVKEYNMQVWGNNDLYPTDYKFKYPKAGESNSIVSVHLYNLDSKTTKEIDLGVEKDFYIPRMSWTEEDNILSIRKMNRLQNKLEIIHADVEKMKTEVVLTEEAKAFVEVSNADEIIYLSDKKHFLYTSERSGYKHIYLYKNNGKLVRQITNGNWDVAQFIGIDQKKDKLYFTSTEVSPLERHFYVIDIKGENKIKLSSAKGTHTIESSPDFKYYINFHSSSIQPTKITLVEMSTNKEIAVLEDNKELTSSLAAYQFKDKEFFNFKTSDNLQLDGYLIKPSNFDANKKYPLLMFVYGGPGSQNVTDSWGGRNDLWHYLLAQKGYIVACVDNRGTDGKGYDFKTATYKNLGKYETQDQIEEAQYLGALKYIDKERIGIWGWSYGGYMSSLCITKGADVFKMAIAVAPVTTWRFYDTIYTERYLQRPQDNPEGYDQNSPIHFAHKLKGNYFLIHGTGDDNVHFQNAIGIQNALIKAGKQFNSFYYPDRNHGIYGGNTRIHLYEMMTNYILNNL